MDIFKHLKKEDRKVSRRIVALTNSIWVLTRIKDIFKEDGEKIENIINPLFEVELELLDGRFQLIIDSKFLVKRVFVAGKDVYDAKHDVRRECDYYIKEQEKERDYLYQYSKSIDNELSFFKEEL